MRVDEEATRLVVFPTGDDRVGHRGQSQVLFERERDTGIAGGTLWRGIGGYGRSGVIRSHRFPDSTAGLPLVLEFVDTPETIESFLPTLAEPAPRSLVTREPVWLSCSVPER